MANNFATSPYYRIIARSTQTNIGVYVDSFTFCDEIGGNDTLDILLKNVPLSVLDETELGEGTILLFSFGYIKGRYSGQRLGRITNIEYRYEKNINLRIKAMDLGIILKKGKKDFTWQDITIKELAQSIATKNGMQLEIDPNVGGIDQLSNRIKFLPQVNETDFMTLKQALQVEGTGDFIVYSKDDRIIIKNRGLGKVSKRTFTWNSPNTKVLNFKPNVRDTSRSEFSSRTEVVGIDPLTGEELRVTSDSGNTAGEVKLGDKAIHYDVDGNERRAQAEALIGETSDSVQARLNKPVDDPKELEIAATSEKVASSQHDLTAVLEIEGDPNIASDDIITMNGVAAKHSGNWYVHKITHKITKAGYKSMLELGKNAANRSQIAGTATLTDVNDTQGDSESNNKKPVQIVKYDTDGNRDDSVNVNPL